MRRSSLVPLVFRGLTAVLALTLLALGALVVSRNGGKAASAASPVSVDRMVEAETGSDRYPALDRLIARLAAEAAGKARLGAKASGR